MSDGKGRKIPSVFITAASALCILRLATSKEQRAVGIKAAKWLKTRQSKHGYWREPISWADLSKKRPSLFLTTLCLEVLKRAGISGVSRKTLLAKEWIIKQQEKSGLWNFRWIPSSITSTVMILELFQNFQYIPSKFNNYQMFARDMINRSKGMITELDSNSMSLAVVMAFEAVEMFLYSALENFGQDILKQNGKHTIGLEAARKRLDTYLYSNQIVDNDNLAFCKKDVLSLANIRDEVVHRGQTVSGKVAGKLVESAYLFIKYYSRIVFKEDILL